MQNELMIENRKLDVVIPAAGRIHGDFATEAGTDIKAMIAFDGKTVLQRTIEAARGLTGVRHVIVIAPEEVAAHEAVREADVVLPEQSSGPANVLRGFEWLRYHNGGTYPERALIVTADLPFINSHCLASFVQACSPAADVCVPVFRFEDFEARFPGSTNFYVPLRDGRWTIGCAFLANPSALTQNSSHLENVFSARKSQLAMARLLGPLFIARLLARRLTVDHIEQRCNQILQCKGAAVRGCAPELAFDIDLLEEYRYAAALLRTFGKE